MGHIMEDVGRVGIEDCGNAFVIHMNYGLRIEEQEVGKLSPGTEFFARDPRQPWEPGGIGLPNNPPPRNIWKVKALYEDKVEAEEQQFCTIATFPVKQRVEAIDSPEIFDPSLPLSDWNNPEKEWSHPEFLYEDIDDLIRALDTLRRRKNRKEE